jgi:hypothetical protein
VCIASWTCPLPPHRNSKYRSDIDVHTLTQHSTHHTGHPTHNQTHFPVRTMSLVGKRELTTILGRFTLR